MAAAAAKAAAATEEERLLHTLGSMKLRASRVATLRRALYANRPQRFIGVCYKKEDEDRAHYVTTVLPELYDALIHIEKVDGNVPIDVVVLELVGRRADGHARDRKQRGARDDALGRSSRA